MRKLLHDGASILFLGCHMDDVEFGCGGLVAKYGACCEHIRVAVLSSQNRNAKGDVQLIRDKEECMSALKCLGLTKEHLIIGNCHGQIFDQEPQLVREELIRLRDSFRPDVVFYPTREDIHQDHKTLSENAMRIFRLSDCFGYEVIRSSYSFTPTVYVSLSEENVHLKAAAIACYKSQQTQSAGYYFGEETVFSTAAFRGAQIGLRYAEAFSCDRLLYR